MDELKLTLVEYFRTNGTIYNKQKNEHKWRELREYLWSLGYRSKEIGNGIKCGNCRQKMYDVLMKLK